MKCFFCNGTINEMVSRCLMCGRSDDVTHELYVQVEQKKKHHNWHNYYGDIRKESIRRRKEREKVLLESTHAKS